MRKGREERWRRGCGVDGIGGWRGALALAFGFRLITGGGGIYDCYNVIVVSMRRSGIGMTTYNIYIMTYELFILRFLFSSPFFTSLLFSLQVRHIHLCLCIYSLRSFAVLGGGEMRRWGVVVGDEEQQL